MNDSWQDQATEMLREVDPTFEKPVYLLDSNDVPGQLHCLALTSRIMAASCRPYIQNWRGSGFCAIFNVDAHRNWHHLEASTLHEFAHFFDLSGGVAAGEKFLLRGGSLDDPEVLERLAGIDLDSKAKSVGPPWRGHETVFIRCLLHLAFRAQRLGWGLYDADLYMANIYGLRSLADYRAALGDEPHEMISLSMTDVAKQPAPASFVDFGESDVRRAQLALEALNIQELETHEC